MGFCQFKKIENFINFLNGTENPQLTSFNGTENPVKII